MTFCKRILYIFIYRALSFWVCTGKTRLFQNVLSDWLHVGAGPVPYSIYHAFIGSNFGENCGLRAVSAPLQPVGVQGAMHKDAYYRQDWGNKGLNLDPFSFKHTNHETMLQSRGTSISRSKCKMAYEKLMTRDKVQQHKYLDIQQILVSSVCYVWH